MSNKSFCDKCGEELEIIGTYDNGEVKTANCMSLRIDVPTFRRKSYDLCDKCVAKFENWMNEKPNSGNIIYYTYDGNTVKRGELFQPGTCLGNNAIYCDAMTGRMSSKNSNLSNIPQNLPKFTTP